MPVAGHVEYSVRQGPAIADAGVGGDRLDGCGRPSWS